jgi:Mn-dependent DtxR family transcriptional regulator
MKPDEAALLSAVARKRRSESVRDVAARLPIHPKRVAYLLGKWARKGWYDYGVSRDLGWLTPAGKAAGAEIPH